MLGSPFGLQLVSVLDGNCSFENRDGEDTMDWSLEGNAY